MATGLQRWSFTTLILFASPTAALAQTATDTGNPSKGQAVDVECTCMTKKNSSWCKLAGDFEKHSWWARPNKPPGARWDAAFLADYCQRHADLTLCLCPDAKNFNGREKN